MIDYDLRGAKTTAEAAERFQQVSRDLESLRAQLSFFLGAIDNGHVHRALTGEIDGWAEKLRDLVDDGKTRAGMVAHAFGEFPPNVSLKTGREAGR